MRPLSLWISFLLCLGLCLADQYGDVLKAIDSMIAQEEQKQHMLAHLDGFEHDHNGPLPHDIAYSKDYSVKDLTDGIAYVEALRGSGKPTLPVFTDKDKSDFTRVDVPSLNLTEQEGLHQTLLQQQSQLDNKQKEQELKLNTLNSLLEEQERLKNPLHDVPTFNTTETPKNFVTECTPDMENGVPCPGGKCFNGKCKPDQECYDDCCDENNFAKADGTPCNGGNCLTGRCRAFPTCIGECCEDPETKLPKPNGTPCSQGHCFEGGCTSDVGCVEGTCCNTVTGRLFPKGFPCHVSACQQKSFCTGTSPFCPETPAKEDGAICTGGVCNKGVCAKTGVVSTTTEICSSGVCCNETSHTFFPAGTPCSNNPCMTGGACTGFSSECSASKTLLPDGTACPKGKCENGVCIAKPLCDPADECCPNGIMKEDYNVCNNGRCFAGACVIDTPCVGECCMPLEGDKLEVRPNGYPCNNNTQICQSGRCVEPPVCVGECCEATGAAEDGKACGVSGQCQKGICVDGAKKCTEGACCNTQDGFLRPKGFPCKANPCSKEMECTGFSEKCPVSMLNEVDGSPCPEGGKCFGGICVLPPKNVPQCTDGPCCDITTLKFKTAGTPCGNNNTCYEATFCTGSSQYCPVSLEMLPDGTICKLTDKEATNWKCKRGMCVEPPPVKEETEIDIDLTRNECHVDSPCCNLSINRVRPKGFVCSVAQNSCMRDTVCDGETPACTPHILEDGSACPGGSCVHGFCVRGIDPTDQDAVHEVHIHVVPKEKHELTPEEAALRTYDDEESEEDSDSMEELMTIITKEADGEVTERSMRLPLNALEKAKKRSLQMSNDAADKNDKKAKSREELVEAAARALIEAEKHNATLAQNATETNSTEINANSTLTNSTDTLAEVQDATLGTVSNILNTTIEVPNLASNNATDATTNPVNMVTEGLTKTTLAFSEAYPMPKAGEIDPLTGLVVTETVNQCDSGACCDLSRGVFFSRGFQCDVPENLCKVAACSGYSSMCYVMNRPNGSVCPRGQCYEGECIASCFGECCDHHNMPRPDGVKCGENGFCFEGACVKKCEGECCNEFGFSKEDGATCTNGFCLDGKCLQTRDDMKEEAAEEALADGVDPEEVPKVMTQYNHPKPHNMEEEWNKMMAKEEEEKHQEKLKEIQEENEEKARANKLHAANRAVVENANLLEASKAKAEKDFKTVMYALAGGCGVLAIVAIVVIIIAKSRKSQQEQEQDEFYDKF